MTVTTFYDQPANDGTWYYRLTTVDSANNESEVSQLASAESDRVGPHAVSITYAPEGPYDPDTGRMGPGIVNFTLTVSEPLQALPFLTITPDGGFPLTVDLSKFGSDLQWEFFHRGNNTLRRCLRCLLGQG